MRIVRLAGTIGLWGLQILLGALFVLLGMRVEEIDSIEAAGHYLEVHTASTTHLIRESMSVLETRLDPARFVRIHRSSIVNVDHIRELQPAFHGEFVITVHSGRRLHCSRTYSDKLTEAMSK